MSVNPTDEYMHPNTGEANFNESMYFNFYDRTRALRRLRPHRQPAERALRGDDHRRLPARRHGAVQLQAAGDRRQRRLRRRRHALRRRRAVQAPARLLRRPRRLPGPAAATSRIRAAPSPATRTGRCRWRSTGTASARCTAARRGEHSEMVFAKGHYEQHGRAAGTLTVDGTAHRVDGFGLRDHSWGPRSWQSPSYYRWLIGQFDDGFGFMGSQIVTQGGSRAAERLRLQGRREPLRRPSRAAHRLDGARPLPRPHRR